MGQALAAVGIALGLAEVTFWSTKSALPNYTWAYAPEVFTGSRERPLRPLCGASRSNSFVLHALAQRHHPRIN